MEYNADLAQLTISVHCSKGTYIRSLAEDIAAKLDTLGHLIELRRVASGDFSDNIDSDLGVVSLGELEQAAQDDEITNCLASVDKIFEFLPKVIVPDEYAIKIQLGIKSLESLENLGHFKNNWVRLYNSQRLFAIAQVDQGVILSRKLLD